MKKKNFKYILIFIFIVCLLIPISCINIFATSINYLISNQYTYYGAGINLNLYNIDKVVFNGNELTLRNTAQNIQLSIASSKAGYVYYNGTTLKSVTDCVSNPIYCYIDLYINDTTYFKKNDTFTYNNYNPNNYTYLTINADKTIYINNVNDGDYIWLQYTTTGWTNSKVYVRFTIHKAPSVITFDKTYNLSFYNNDILYDSITISGASTSGYAPFEEISQIKYGNTIVYDNSVWSSGYNSTLRYNQNMTMPDVMQLNIDCDNIVTFYVQLYYVYSEYSQTYNIGTFYNKSQQFNSIQVNGLTIGNNKFSSIDTIYYNEIKVYENNNFINSFDEDLYYMYNDINITDINTACNNIVIFTKTHIQPTTDDDILYGVGNILTIIKDFANMLLLNKVTIYCCVAIPLLSFAVFIVVKLKNGNDGDNKIN